MKVITARYSWRAIFPFADTRISCALPYRADVSTYDPTDVRSVEREKDEQDTRDRLAREVEDADWKWLMASKRGRRVVWRMLEQSGVFRLSFNTNALSMAFAEGNRNYGNRVLGKIHELCPELYPTMVKENTNGSRDGDAGTKSN